MDARTSRATSGYRLPASTLPRGNDRFAGFHSVLELWIRDERDANILGSTLAVGSVSLLRWFRSYPSPMSIVYVTHVDTFPPSVFSSMV